MNYRKIAVIGAGAVGSLVGGLLSKAGEDVILIGRKAHVDAINRNGLLINGELGDIKVRIKAKEKLDFIPDLVLLAVKTQDVASALSESADFIKGIPIVTMQNGVKSDEITAGIAGRENIISCVVFFGSTYLEPGKITYSPKGSLAIGEAFGTNGNRIKKIKELLNKALPTFIVKDIQAVHWSKLIVNLINCLPAVTGLSYRKIAENKELLKLLTLLIKEGFFVLHCSGIKISSIPGVPVSLFKALFKLPFFITNILVKAMFSGMGNFEVIGSTLQSIRRGKTTEIDYLNGEIVNLGKNHNIPAPYNKAILEAIHMVESGGKFFSPTELLSAVNPDI